MPWPDTVKMRSRAPSTRLLNRCSDSIQSLLRPLQPCNVVEHGDCTLYSVMIVFESLGIDADPPATLIRRRTNTDFSPVDLVALERAGQRPVGCWKRGCAVAQEETESFVPCPRNSIDPENIRGSSPSPD